MLRNGAARLALRAVPAPAIRPAASFRPASQWTTQFSTVASKRPQTLALAQLKPLQVAVMRRGLSQERKEAEKKYAHEELKPTPETVSTRSSMHPIVGELGDKDDTVTAKEDVSSGVKRDLDTVAETFSLKEVPREAYYIGLAGVLPYLATSVSTMICAEELSAAAAGHTYLMSSETASTLLHLLEPLQVGYGAVILSFLGAIHWGLEFAGYGGHHGYRRYAIGVWTPAIAWPTLLMPFEYALISQFLGFVALYYVDTRATYRGWTPPWYAIYRFVLTFIVGASIVASLVGRGKIANKETLRENPQEKMAEQEEAIRLEKLKEVDD
ncbi:hypothetical protein DM02DRAFT_640207 [Periconia macrospinosa]|uniref:Mitochondrial inner membrane protein 1 n=1 Tax=Periconia macrospinosa TaxID=97972 RepID=A0A2V1E172_9PLEO|nr:hypothetical protein DM02DRAFT_640207 [Periconia macrospinosa]